MISVRRINLIVGIFIFTYLCVPKILLFINYDMWGSFTTETIIYNKDLITNFDIFISYFLVLIFVLISNIDTNQSQYIDNKLIYIITFLLILFYYKFSYELIIEYFNLGKIDRNFGVSLWLNFINNGFNSYLFTLSILFITSAYYNKNYYFIFTILIVILFQLLSGMRSEFTRLITVIFALLPRNKIYLIVIPLLILMLNRQIIFGYDYDMRSFFGDAINVIYGYHIIHQIELIECNAFNSLLRIFVPPGLREEFFLNSGDLVICLNTLYYKPSGIGNSILTDINKYPLETLLILALYIFFAVIFPKKYKYLILILALSALPHIMRLGFITGVSYSISFLLWIIVPVLLINELFIKFKK